MRAARILTTSLLVMIAACVGPNPAYRGLPSEVLLDADAAVVERQPSGQGGAGPGGEVRDGGASEPVTTEVSSDALVADQPPRLALLVVGDLALEPVDVQSRDRLVALGFTVTVELDANATAADASGMDLVLISGSSSSSQVRSKFKAVPVPTICHDSWGFPLMGLTGPSGGTDYGLDDDDTPPDTRIAIVMAHPLSAGLSGVVTVSDKAIGLSWGKPLPSAAAVATLVGDASRITVFGHLAGAPLHDGTTSPARRVGSFVRNPVGARFAVDGMRLFDAAVAWATAR